MTITDLCDQATLINIHNINTVMVLAPHPDDESLGCGGFIAMLTAQNKKVFVVFITDGSMSHPNSKKYPADKLAALRRKEALDALKELNVDTANIFFMNEKDRALPAPGETGFNANTEELQTLINFCNPDLILVPYEKDPHPDHRATWQMLNHIRKKNAAAFSILEYIIWLYNLGEEKDLPEQHCEWLYADITDYLNQKHKAVFRHVSQTTHLIDDDPTGFILTPDVLQHFNYTKEYFLNRNL